MKSYLEFDPGSSPAINSQKQKTYNLILVKKAVVMTSFYLLIMTAFVLMCLYVIELDDSLIKYLSIFSDRQVFMIFFVSESTLGAIPPDIYLIWTSKSSNPIFILCVLGVMSYFGGLNAYHIGNWLASKPKARRFLEDKLSKYIQSSQKWGDKLIVLSALFPFTPYTLVLVSMGIFNYPYKNVMLCGLFRILRFIVQGIIFLEVFGAIDNYTNAG
ncbi:MAG: YqaA family protein [Bacteroidota bacterium]